MAGCTNVTGWTKHWGSNPSWFPISPGTSSQDFSMVLCYRSFFSSRKSLQKQALLSYARTNKSQFWQAGGEVNNKVNFKAVSVNLASLNTPASNLLIGFLGSIFFGLFGTKTAAVPESIRNNCIQCNH